MPKHHSLDVNIRKSRLITNRKDKREIIELLAQRDGGFFCRYCGCDLAQDNKNFRQITKDNKTGSVIYSWNFPDNIKPVTIDHVVPRDLGGTNDLDNLCLSCQSCNSKKGNK